MYTNLKYIILKYMTASSDYPPLSGGDIHIYLLHLEVSTKLEVIKDLSNLYFIDERIKG